MKRSFALFAALFASVALQAESIKLKDGTILSGSILSQTQYTLNLATSYGTVTLNQKEIEQILPDKHRILLKGGTQLVGVILDLDEFNLKLQTDSGVVNIDMPQIANIEVYDYDQGQKQQQQYVEQKIETAAQAAQKQEQVAQTGKVEAAGGLSFDSDIDKVFDAQNATVVGGRVVTTTPTSPVQATPQNPQLLSDEEAFLKGVKSGTVSQQEYATAAKTELASKKSAKKETSAKKEKDFNKSLSLQLGVMPLDLKLNVSGINGFQKETDPKDVGGTSIAVSGKFLWRVMDGNFWLGPTLGIANIDGASFPDLDPDVAAANDTAASSGKPIPYPDPTVKTSGQILNFGLSANYYINPQSLFSFYLTANAGYEMLTLNYRGTEKSQSFKSNGIAGGAGVGVETRIDDLYLGLEVRQQFAARSDELEDSSATNTVFSLQANWKF